MPKDIATTLRVTLGQASSAGSKPENQDFHGARLPEGRALALKGVTLAIADGISTSEVSAVAAETTVKALLTDYYDTPDSWTVKTAASRVISATNSWLQAQSSLTGIGDVDRGYVCTLAAMIIKARTAHLFHVGDSRIWRLSGQSLEPLTDDHRATYGGHSVLARAMGAGSHVDIDYRTVDLTPGDIFLLTTDGVHDFWRPSRVAQVIRDSPNFDSAAQQIITDALEAGSTDNLTLQILRIDALADSDLGFNDVQLPVPPLPRVGDMLDDYEILRSLHGNHRSHLFLAKDPNGAKVALKIPGPDMAEDSDALRKMVMEEWIARRIDSPHVLHAPPSGRRTALYIVLDYIEGQTLRQWMRDNPKPDLGDVRDILEQLIKGLRAFHRREMLHQDIRPENVMITRDGVVKLIDFGAAFVAGVQEAAPERGDDGITGTYQYTAPEYFANEAVSWRAELFSVGVIAYEMLTGHLPYGTQAAKVRSTRDRQSLRYRNARDDAHPIPDWLDDALRKAVNPDPLRRHDALSEFTANLRAPSISYQARHKRPLAERDPERFWKTLSGLLALLCLILLARSS